MPVAKLDKLGFVSPLATLEVGGRPVPSTGAALIGWDDETSVVVFIQWDDETGFAQYLEWDV